MATPENQTREQIDRQRNSSLRQSILRQAFTGQLVPQDPNDEPASVLLERIKVERAAGGDEKASQGRGRRMKADQVKLGV